MTSATEPKKELEVLRGSLQHIPAGMSRVVLHTGVNLYLSGEPWKHDFLSGQKKKKKRQFGAVSCTGGLGFGFSGLQRSILLESGSRRSTQRLNLKIPTTWVRGER